MITRRDIVVALIAASGTFAVVAAQQPTAADPQVTGLRLDRDDAEGERLRIVALDRPGADGDAR